jgi:hypothetical protein
MNNHITTDGGDNRQWLINTRNTLQSNGWKVFPSKEIINDEGEKETVNLTKWGGAENPDVQPPANNDPKWNEASSLGVAVPPGVVFIDWDGYKAGSYDLNTLAMCLGFESVDGLWPSLVQYKDGADSMHFGFNIPLHVNLKNLADIYGKGCNVDQRPFGGQLFIKPGKLFYHGNSLPRPEHLPRLPETGLALLPVREEFTKTSDTPVAIATEDNPRVVKLLIGECDELCKLESARNETLNNIALDFWGFVAGGDLTQDTMVNHLLKAYITSGKDERGGRATINSAKTKGTANPKTLGGGSDAASTFGAVNAHMPANALLDSAKPLTIGKEAIDLTEQLGAKIDTFIYSQVSDVADEKATIAQVDVKVMNLILNRCFWSGAKSKLQVVSNSRYVNLYNEKDSFRLVQKSFGQVVENLKEIEDQLKKVCDGRGDTVSDKKLVVGGVREIVETEILDYMKDIKQREQRQYMIDLYENQIRVNTNNPDSALIELPRVPCVAPIKRENINQAIVADYKEHFPMFDEVLQFIVDSRVAPDRKKAYIWFHCDSDWGKGFFIDCIGQLRAGVHTSMEEVKKMYKSEPAGKTPEMFIDSMVLLVDEVRSVNNEFKKLQNELSFAPKNQATVTVPLYSKMIFSAENIPSLVTPAGVEDQFANRLSLITAKGRIDDRPMFYQMGKGVYFNNIKSYVAHRFNDAIDAYVAMGKDAAEFKADQALTAFHSRNGIANHFATLSESIPGMAKDFIQWCVKVRGEHNGARGQDTETGCSLNDSKMVAASTVVSSDSVYIKTPNKIVAMWMDSLYEKSSSRTVCGRATDIMNAADVDGAPKRRRIKETCDNVVCIKATLKDINVPGHPFDAK